MDSYFALKESGHAAVGSTGQLVNASADGCNRLIGFYKTNGHSLRFEGLTTTAMFCLPTRLPPPSHETSSFERHGRTLELFGKHGAILARFEATTPN